MARFIKQPLHRLYAFLAHGIWERDLGDLSRIRREFYRLGQFFTLLARNFQRDQILLRASSLTYTTLLAIVPLIGLMLAILKAFGMHQDVMPQLLEYLTAGNVETIKGLQELSENVVSYIDQTNTAAFGFVSFIIIAASVGSLLRACETSFNAIWRVRRARPFFVKLRDYTFILIITPLMLFAGYQLKNAFSDVALEPLKTVVHAFHALVTPYPNLENSATIWLASLDGIATFGYMTLGILPVLLLWGLFTFIYAYAPYAKVPIGAAMLGGFCGAVVWQVAFAGYVQFQFGMVRYNRIYGALAGLIFSLLWIYVSWVIVLIGAQVSYVLPSLENYRRNRQTDTPSPAARERLAVVLMTHTARHYQLGSAATMEALAAAADLPETLTGDLLAQLERRKLIVRAATDDERVFHFLPARPADEITLEDIVVSIREDGESFGEERANSREASDRILAEGERTMREALRRTTLDDVASARAVQSDGAPREFALSPPPASIDNPPPDFVTARAAADDPSRAPA